MLRPIKKSLLFIPSLRVIISPAIILAITLASVPALALDTGIKSLSADFVQRVGEQGGIAYTGSLRILAPHFALWQYKSPIPKTLYLNAKTLISYEPTLAQVIYQPIEGIPNFLQILQNAKPHPKLPNCYLSKIEGREYELFLADGKPQKLRYQDAMGNLVLIEFHNLILNPKLSPQDFDFTPPEGVDILKP